MKIVFRLERAALALMIAAGSGMSLCPQAEARPGFSDQAFVLAGRSGVSLEQAAARVKRKIGGRILSAETITRKGRRVHRIKVLRPNGNVKVVFVNSE
jgi:Peptidase propeptide and YPEB domain